MNKKQIGITLGVMCLILTMAIAIQVRTMNNANSTASQTLADNELRDSVLKWKEKYDNVSNELKKAEKKLEQVRQQATQNDTTSIEKENELKDELKLLAMPLIKFLKENYNPYCKVEVSEKGVKIVGDVCLIPIK